MSNLVSTAALQSHAVADATLDRLAGLKISSTPPKDARVDETDDQASELARVLASRIKALHATHATNHGSKHEILEPIPEKNLIILAARMIRLRDDFKAKNIPCKVDIACHYTLGVNVPSIEKHGLLTKAERDEGNINSNFNGSSYGDGIYMYEGLASPWNEIGIVVARVKGVCAEHPVNGAVHNTLVGSVARFAVQINAALSKNFACLKSGGMTNIFKKCSASTWRIFSLCWMRSSTTVEHVLKLEWCPATLLINFKIIKQFPTSQRKLRRLTEVNSNMLKQRMN